MPLPLLVDNELLSAAPLQGNWCTLRISKDNKISFTLKTTIHCIHCYFNLSQIKLKLADFKVLAYLHLLFDLFCVDVAFFICKK